MKSIPAVEFSVETSHSKTQPADQPSHTIPPGTSCQSWHANTTSAKHTGTWGPLWLTSMVSKSPKLGTPHEHFITRRVTSQKRAMLPQVWLCHFQMNSTDSYENLIAWDGHFGSETSICNEPSEPSVYLHGDRSMQAIPNGLPAT